MAAEAMPESARGAVSLIVNGVYAVASLTLAVFAAKLFNDRWRTFRAVRRQNHPSPQDMELTAHDLKMEGMRLGKQTMAVLLLWIPLFVRPVIREWADRPLFELMRAGVFLMLLGLVISSYWALRFNARFRDKWGRRAKPIA